MSLDEGFYKGRVSVRCQTRTRYSSPFRFLLSVLSEGLSFRFFPFGLDNHSSVVFFVLSPLDPRMGIPCHSTVRLRTFLLLSLWQNPGKVYPLEETGLRGGDGGYVCEDDGPREDNQEPPYTILDEWVFHGPTDKGVSRDHCQTPTRTGRVGTRTWGPRRTRKRRRLTKSTTTAAAGAPLRPSPGTGPSL